MPKRSRTQLELCEAAGIPMPTANNWISTGSFAPPPTAGRGPRKPRSSPPSTIDQAKVTRRRREWMGFLCSH